jgi:hypothetical protein
MKSMVLKLTHNLKKACNEILVVVLAFLGPIIPLLLVVGAFIFADTVMGIWRAKKQGGWKAVNSKEASQILSKSVLYSSAVILIFILEKFIIGDILVYLITVPFFLTKVIATTCCVIEMKSIDENYTKMFGYSLWSRFKDILRRAKETKDEIKEIVD